MLGKRIIGTLLGEANIGRLEYLFKPELRNAWGGPFNGQTYRRRIFTDLMSQVKFNAIVETGSYRGTTTEWFGSSGLPVYSAEINRRLCAYSKLRFRRDRDHIHIFQSDSPTFLRNLATSDNVPKSRAFFYLDAHWEKSLPLAEELEIIFTQWRESVVMVDDFQVPGTSYGYDNYGGANVLNLGYLKRLEFLQMSPYFPAAGPEQETGRKRGCVVLCREKELIDILDRIPTLVSAAKCSSREEQVS